MVKHSIFAWLFLIFLFLASSQVSAQQAGTIRGMIYDKDFDAPLPNAQIQIAETGQKVTSTDEGNYVFPQVEPGTYTLVFSKEGFTRQLKADVVVTAGQMTEVDIWLSGDFTDMEEFVVQDVQLGAGTEIALLELRMESPALMDSISADLMSQAGMSDAASALRLVAGASIQDGKFAVVRGLPDRYVNSQMNAVRLPTADADKRAVQLDQFPASVIESIQVSKTFTPDQQGDASGGAVNVVLKDVPDETVFNFSAQYSYKTQVSFRDDFLSYEGGGVNYWGFDDGDRDIQSDNIGQNWDGSVGVSETDAPVDYKWSISGGGKYDIDDDLKIGAFGSFFYERDASFYDDGIDDKYWVEEPGNPMTPQYIQGSPNQDDFKTQLFDVTQSSEGVQWGGLGVLGVETENHSISFHGMYTRDAEDVTTLAEDTRGKYYYFPTYDLDDPRHVGNQERSAAPFLRTETLEYTERSTHTLQLQGDHKLPDPGVKFDGIFSTLQPEIDWGIARSGAYMDQPDKRQFGSTWWAESYSPGFSPYVPPSIDPAVHRPFKPAANFTLGNLQRVWKDISEESDQYFTDIKLPYEQWTGDEGYLKMGGFYDYVSRDYNQESFSNFNDNSARYEGPWEDLWSEYFSSEDHPITPAEIDVDYDGEQVITAGYGMLDLPVASYLTFIGGARYETTELSITNYPEENVTWIPPGSLGSVQLNEGDADVAFEQQDLLPSLGFELTPIEEIMLRGSYTETVARQTFKELSPIQQQEFLGGDVFIGNPFLQMSAIKNYDIRLDYTPYQGGLVSLSYFYKDIKDPIEYVQRNAGFTYTTAVNYPEGELSGYEFEVRQRLGQFWDPLEGLSIGGNATFINSEVSLPAEEREGFNDPNINAPMNSRDMTNAPEYLYNLYISHDLTELGLKGTQLSLFYTVTGDTLVAGAGQSNGKFVPDIYEKKHGTLNFSWTQNISNNWKIKFQAKNLTDPKIERVYRSKYIDDDVTKTSYRKGREFSLSISASF